MTQIFKRLIDRLPERYQLTLHNLVGHPAEALCHLVGLYELGNFLHDATLPTRGKTQAEFPTPTIEELLEQYPNYPKFVLEQAIAQRVHPIVLMRILKLEATGRVQ